ncbi:MAG TPA: hypothetical protein VKA94_12610 [Hyphomicrobiales bacterium]|nr:hypothetical protein [Hyphomicrobiales bacterium]
MTLETLKTSPPIPSGLSKSLRPWAGLFHDMPEAHLRLIGGLMGQLNPLFEETFNIDAQSYGEFNSYDGIDMRGDIERLMPSEWLWRDLVPEEFLRRFAEQELFYHKPSFETPTDERTHLVAIDCGPGMLGRPRLIALAALLSLSAIARRQGAKLLWTAPQADIADWQTLLTRKDLQAFLLAANPVSLEESQLDSLLQKLPGKSSEAELMLWMIGSKKLVLGDDTIKSNQVIISERMAIDADEHPFAEVSIRLHSYFGRVKEATLSYPPEEDCVSLLREPFRPRRMKTVRKLTNEREANPSWAPQGILLFPDVNKMIVRIKEGLLLLRLGPLDGGFHEPLLIPIKSFDNILGLRLIHDQLTIALTRKYNGFSQLTLKRFTCRPGPRNVADDIAEVRLDQNDPLAVDKHPRNALPALLKPGRKFRLLAMTSKGEQYVIQKHAVKPHGQLSHLSIIGMRDHWAFTLAGPRTKDSSLHGTSFHRSASVSHCPKKPR